MNLSDPYCDHLASPNPWALSLSIFLVAGILFSYLPQHFKIIHHATSAGLSPWWVLLGTLSSIAALGNVVVLPTTQHDMACCREISGAACGAALLGVVQIGVQWLCFMTIMILFLVFFPRDPKPDVQSDSTTPAVPNSKDALTVGLTSLLTLLLTILISTIFLARYPALLLHWANFLGLAASILSCIQYIPQLYTTYKAQQILSLSITTMLIQVPGSFLFAFSLWLRVGWQGWSTWCVYCVTGSLQAGLLGLAVGFWVRDRREKGVEEEEEAEAEAEAEGPTETDPLLSRVTNGRA